jgi:SAM-dependent methyltransferase
MSLTTEQTERTATGAAFDKAVPFDLRIADLWRAPLTDLPIRDELIRQYVPLTRALRLLEAGPGAGFASYRLARCVSVLTLLEVASGNAEALASRFAANRIVRVVQDDLCRPQLGAEYAAEFDAIVCIEVLEFVADPATALRNMAQMLRPGGRLSMQFPNYQTTIAPTFYSTRQEFESQLAQAGFAGWEIYSLQLSAWAQRLYALLHELPLRLYRRREQRRNRRPQSPQTYEQTWAFRQSARLERLKLPLHLYWAAIMLLMRLGGDVFQRVKCDDEIYGKNLFVVAHAAKDGNTR